LLGLSVELAIPEPVPAAAGWTLTGVRIYGFDLEFQVADSARQRGPLASCCGIRFEDVLPARPFRFEKGLRSFAGRWYFATTDAHVEFESRLERIT
jgi:hypothetical protein